MKQAVECLASINLIEGIATGKLRVIYLMSLLERKPEVRQRSIVKSKMFLRDARDKNLCRFMTVSILKEYGRFDKQNII